MTMTEARPIRACDECPELDDYPRHVQVLAGGVRVVRHMSCCAATGCAICQATEAELGGVTGQELTETILGGALDGFVIPTERSSDHG